MYIVAITVDEYLGFKYIIPTRLASHPAPYVKVLTKDDSSIAYILLKTSKVIFYNPSDDTAGRRPIIETWISKNLNLSKKIWNKENEVKI